MKRLLARHPAKIAAVAQTNKTACMIWALVSKGGKSSRPIRDYNGDAVIGTAI
ncbi:hypothetical protein ACVWYQ_003265 [Bradyrhizobium sp. USDA 3397]